MKESEKGIRRGGRKTHATVRRHKGRERKTNERGIRDEEHGLQIKLTLTKDS